MCTALKCSAGGSTPGLTDPTCRTWQKERCKRRETHTFHPSEWPSIYGPFFINKFPFFLAVWKPEFIGRKGERNVQVDNYRFIIGLPDCGTKQKFNIYEYHDVSIECSCFARIGILVLIPSFFNPVPFFTDILELRQIDSLSGRSATASDPAPSQFDAGQRRKLSRRGLHRCRWQ